MHVDASNGISQSWKMGHLRKKICYANSKGFLQAHHKNINWAEVIVYVARQA